MTLDEFDRIKVVGKGSYGEVWLVRHKKDKKQYVLKKMNLQRASKRERSSAEQEAKLLSKLKHPNIVSYKDSFETAEGNLYIAMQYCEGGDLYTRLKEQKGILLPERQVVEWFVQIAMALQYMHERHILHRDLKTQNIFLTKSKIIKVGDLGIARVLDNCTDMATTLIGTPYYMSPELFSNKPYNHKSDVWALGCCVYEMATLKHAFNAKDMNSLVYKILKGKMPQMPKQYSPELNAIIKSLLHQDPDRRPSVNRILRDPFIKTNIAIFLEETKKNCRRPGTASRPSSSSGNRQSSALSNRSDSQKPKLPVSNCSDKKEGDTVDSAVAPFVSKEQVSVGSGDAQEISVPHKSHSRKPSDGAKPMEPIHEKLEEKDKASLHSSSESTVKTADTVVAVTVVNKETENPEQQEKKEKRKRRKYLGMKAQADEKEHSEKSKVVEVDLQPALPKSPPRKSSGISKLSQSPRPLPVLPKAEESEGLPQKHDELVKKKVQKEERSDSSKSSASSVSSSKEEYPITDLETPRSLPNMSARERRRSRNPAAASSENPTSARIKLVKVQYEPSDKKTRSRESESQKVKQVSKKGMRQPSIRDESSSEEEVLASTSEKEKRRENKEIHNFISLLDITLHLNHGNDKSDEEELVPVFSAISEENGTSEKTPHNPPVEQQSVCKVNSMPSVETLTDSNRLMKRIRLLHTDCIKGVGYDILRKAYDILNKIDEDEIEPKLVDLMGKEKFDEYAGKIWQLKFCEESLF